MSKHVFNTETHIQKRGLFSVFFNTSWMIVLLMIGLIAGCKKDDEPVGRLGICPAVISTDPINGAINVVTDKKISATFNENMNVATINTSTFQLRHGINQVLGTVSIVGSTATFTPVEVLMANTVYTATITGAARDSANTALPVSYSWSFNTGNTPTVVITDPVNGASDVPFNKLVTATFSTNMNPATINGSSFIIKQGASIVSGVVSYTGMTATFTPTTPLLPKTVYTGTVKGSADDVLGNTMATDYVWSFSTGIVPSVVATDPANATINVVLDKKITATFNKLMDATTINTANFTVKQGSSLIAGTVSYSGKTALFVPTSPLDANTVYIGTITAGTKDSSGNNLPVDYVWSFTTGNAPIVISTDPTNGATNVPFNKVITASFSTAMNPASINGSTVIIKLGATAVTGTVSYVGTSAVFVPTSPLNPNTVYTGTITTGAKDALGNAIGANYTWSFTTTSLPTTVISTDPADGATNVALNKIVIANFSQPMNPSTINAVTFVVKQGFNQVFGTVSYSGTTASFTPVIPFASNTVYTCTIYTGVKDVQGNALANNYTWNFTTAIVTIVPPTVILTDPANAEINVALDKDISAKFSKAMDVTTMNVLNFVVKQGAKQVFGTVTYAGTTATFSPATPLTSNTIYTCTLTTGAKDAQGNALANNYTWDFTTAIINIVSPTVVSADPANGATNVPLNKLISATFSEVMDPTTINVLSFQVKQGLNQVFGNVSYIGKTATFTPATPLISNTVYTCTITTGSKDVLGNPLLNSYVWNFTTLVVNIVSPTVISTDPTDGATKVSISKIVTANFSMLMDPLTISNSTFIIKQGATIILGAVTYVGTTATFFPLSNFNTNTLYTATITTNAKNLAGVGLANNYVWSFTTAQPLNPPPDLGSAVIYGAFGGNAGITNQGINTVINGSIGTTAASSLITGFHDGTTGDVYTETPLNMGKVTGRIFTAPPFPGTAASMTIAQNGLLDATNTYNNISPAGKPGGIDPGAGELGGLTLAPGVYKAAAGTFKITNGDLTLDAKGDPNAVWIFQTEAGLTVGVAGPAGAKSVKMINGALPKNVFWYVGSAAVINGAGGGIMSGTIIASAGVTFSTAGNAVQTVLNGRAISLGASVTMVNTTINVQ